MKQMLIVKASLLVLTILLASIFFDNIDFLNSVKGRNIVLANNNLSLFATNISNNSITLEWIDNLIGETGFKVEKKIGDCSNNNSFSQIKTLEANTTSYIDYNVSFGFSYCYRVRGFLGSLNSSYSNEIFVSIPENNNTLSFSANHLSIDLGEEIKLTWSAFGAVYCEASDAWNGEKPISASQIIYPEKTSSYTISCIWSDKTVISKSVAIEVKGSKEIFGEMNYCYRNTYSNPSYQSSCLITPENHSNCKLALSDRLSLNVIVPSYAVNQKSNLRISIHNLDEFEDIPDNIGYSEVIKDRIIQISVKDKNCQKVDLLKEIAINFSYPQSYANDFNENSFEIKKINFENNSWNNILNKKNTPSNIIVGIDKDLGYFSLFGLRNKIYNNSLSYSKNISSTIPIISYNSPEENNNSEIETPITNESNKKESIFKYLLASLANQTRNIGWKLAISVSIIFSVILILWFFYKRKLFKKIALNGNLNVSNLYNNKISDIKNRMKKKKEQAISVSSISYNKEKIGEIIERSNDDVLIVREV